MPDLIWVVKDTVEDKYLTGYNSANPEWSQWGLPANALTYSTKADADDIADNFEGEAGRFIGSNPPTPPPPPPGH